MIEKNSIEWELWKDAYNLRSELTPPPDYNETTSEYWAEVLEEIHKSYDKYKDTYLKELATYIHIGILLQIEQESLSKGAAQELIRGVAEKLANKDNAGEV